MQKTAITGLAIAVLLALFPKCANSQIKGRGLNRVSVYSNKTYGFRVHYEGTLVRDNKDECLITLPSTDADRSGSQFLVAISQKPFVYLPGTYGGKYFFSPYTNDRVSEDRVNGDSVFVNGLAFERDYWAVYAGMGHWETVTNCYAYHDGKYYVLSFVHNFTTQLPGEIVNGVKTTKAEMRTTLIHALRDTTNDYVRSFRQILGSFSITK